MKVDSRRIPFKIGRWARLMAAMLLLMIGSGIGSTPAHAQAAGCVIAQPGNVDQKTAVPIAVPGCVNVANDPSAQTVFSWTITAAQVSTLWSMHVTGIAGSSEVLSLFHDPGDAAVSPTKITDFNEITLGGGIQTNSFLLPPGAYLVGVATTGAGAYTLSVSVAGALPKNGDSEPNDSAAQATNVKARFALSGDLQASDDWYAWTLSKADATKHWTLSLQTAIGETSSFRLLDATGNQLASIQVDALGRADLADLGLAAGTYTIQITAQTDHPAPYALQTTPGADRTPGTENEPNDSLLLANPFDRSNAIYGHVSSANDQDYFRFHVDKTLATQTFDLTLMASAGLDRKICLVDSDGGDTLCAENTTGLVALAGLSLLEGEHVFRVAGDASPADEYSVDLLVTGAVDPGQETLPNDRVSNANALNGSNEIKGKFGLGTGDRHIFKLHTAGDPQLWQVQAVGGGIQSLRIVDASDVTLSEGTVSSDGTYAAVNDQFFTPGDHWIAVQGANSAFSVAATAMGAPDPNGEREPNNNLEHSEILKMGAVRTGRLRDVNDADVYRFSLAATEHVLIKIQSPADGQIHTDLQWYGASVQNSDARKVGELTVWDVALKAGDYSLWLRADTPGEQKYQISFERADPFVLAADQEPNNTFVDASPLPASLSVTGMVGQFNDSDWFKLPALSAAADVVLTLSTADVRARIFDAAGNELPVSLAADQLSAQVNLPANTALAMKIDGGNVPYTVSLAFTPGPAAVKLAKSSITVTLSLGADQVAAYWNLGQRIDGVVKLTNSGLLPQTVDLAAAASHFAWSLDLTKTTALVPPGAGVEIPVVLTIQPDAWADVPVRLTVRALSKNGAIATGFVEITPGRDAPPAQPQISWPVPPALLGGLDVASLALGAKAIASVDQAAEDQLHDGFATVGGGFHTGSTVFPLKLTVQLAGTGPGPIAGIILNPLNTETPASWVRGFKLMLSTDGVTYAEALSGELQPLAQDQAFVLPAPVMATYAQLVVLSDFGTDAAQGSVSLGEWKVIATPGFTPAAERTDVAALANGGHIVTMNPQFESQSDAGAMLDRVDPALKSLSLEAGIKPSWIVGFSEERAAQITELQWLDPPGSIPDHRFTNVTIEVSPESVFGPWTKVGEWTLKRADDGSVQPFTLDKPVWARFVRFTGNGPKEKTDWEYPAQIKILERPTDASYQSILGQWGYGNQAGPYELANPPVLTPAPPAQSNATKETAAALAPNTDASGRVQIGKQVAWYNATAPADQNTLTFTITGDPVADALVHVFDQGGVEIPTRLAPARSARTAVYQASVTPGATYRVEVVQPVHSIVFAFDTSVSMAAYEAMVQQALKAFAADVTPGQEYVNIMPFDDPFVLKEWSDQPYAIQSALSAYTDANLSSSSEKTMLDAMSGLSGRDGSKAILLVTDAETSSYDQTSVLWPALAAVGPRIFAVHVGSGADGGVSRHSMQDWASATNGFYQYAQTQGDMDRAFDRLATTMRRPVGFTMSYQATSVKAPTPTPAATAVATPVDQKLGSLQVTMKDASANAPAAAISTDIAVEIILDTSGSMLQELELGKTRIDVARATLVDLVSTKLPAGVPVALRTFADDPGSCDTILRSPLAPLDPSAMASAIQNVGVTNLVKTPIGGALDQVASDLAGVKGPKIIVLVTDGEETCGGDPAASISRLTAQGFDVQVNIVGFALDSGALKATFETWARLGHGSYFDATNSTELNTAVAKALAPPIQVFDSTGAQVASGRVGGDPIALPAGTYRVEVLSDPKRTFATVTIKPGKTTKLALEDGDTG